MHESSDEITREQAEFRARISRKMDAPNPAPPPAEPEEQAMSIPQVVERVNLAASTMSRKNPNRVLILNLGRAIVQLAERLEQSEIANAQLRRELQAVTAVEAPRIVIP